MGDHRRGGLTRREVLKRGAAGGAVIWATPVVQVIGMRPAFAQTTSPAPESPCATTTEITVAHCFDVGDPDGVSDVLQFTVKTTFAEQCCGERDLRITWTSKVVCGPDCDFPPQTTTEHIFDLCVSSDKTTTHTYELSEACDDDCRIEVTAHVLDEANNVLSQSSDCGIVNCEPPGIEKPINDCP